MAIDFSSITLEFVDISTNATPDIYINQNSITFSKRVLEELNYPQNVQFGIDAAQHIFAIKPCKGNESRATPVLQAEGRADLRTQHEQQESVRDRDEADARLPVRQRHPL